MFGFAAVLLNFDAAFACNTKAMAYRTALKSDLRNLVSAQEAFFADSQRFTNDLEALGFRKSTGVAAITIDEVADSGWTATATHTQTPVFCHIFVGRRPLSAPAAVGEAEPWCEGEPPRISHGLMLGLWAFLLVLSLTTLVFLKQVGKRNWPAMGLLVLSLLYFVILIPTCGGQPTPTTAAVFMIPGLLLFTFALRRRVVAR